MTNINHPVCSMRLAVCRSPTALKIVAWSTVAGRIRATFAEDIHHSIHGMQLAVQSRSAPLGIVARSPHAGEARATFVGHVYHPVHSMFFAVFRLVNALGIKARSLRAGVMSATVHPHRAFSRSNCWDSGGREVHIGQQPWSELSKILTLVESSVMQWYQRTVPRMTTQLKYMHSVLPSGQGTSTAAVTKNTIDVFVNTLCSSFGMPGYENSQKAEGIWDGGQLASLSNQQIIL